MTRLPTPWGKWIDRKSRLSFSFEGKSYPAHPGDTVASALLANEQSLIGRSFKYHRPRGSYSAAGWDANTLVQAGSKPNLSADRLLVQDHLQVKALNYFGCLKRDWGRLVEKASRLLPAGFYYKTFFTPRIAWKFWEPVIRHMAGLGRVDLKARHAYYDKEYLFADVAVIGAGPAGLAAALEAAKAGAEVILIDEDQRIGGSLNWARGGDTEPMAKLAGEPRITLLEQASVQALFDDNWLEIVKGNRLYKLRAKSVVAATGCYQMPLVFRHNDLPGVMLGSAVQRMMRLWGVRPAKRAVVATANDEGYAVALDLLEAGIEVAAIADLRQHRDSGAFAHEAGMRGLRILQGFTPYEAHEKNNRLAGVSLAQIISEGRCGPDFERIDCDLLAVCVGRIPATGLLSHAGAKFAHQANMDLPTSLPAHVFAAGSVNGCFALSAAQQDGKRAGALAAKEAGYEVKISPAPMRDCEGVTHPWPIFAHPKGKEFVDLDEDVQIKDILASMQDGYDHIQLLKRYSTSGMGPSQGKLFWPHVQRLMAKEKGVTPAEIGASTIRPPMGGETLGHLAGRGFEPVRLTAMHQRHLELGAVMMPAGAWMRPAYYGQDEKAIESEVLAVRNSVGLIDVSTLGGLDVRGPDASAFLERLYTWSYAKLAVGRARYVLMCDQTGVVIDDGVAARLHDQHFYVTATTSGVDRVFRLMQWYNAQWRMQVDIAQVTSAYAAVNLAGPRAREVLAKAGTNIDIAKDALPYLGVREGLVAGIEARILRIGFVGELGYEIHVPAQYGQALWDALMAAGQEVGIKPFGVEAQRILRLEKGHIIIGQDSDALTHPFEIGMDWAVKMDKPFFMGQAAIRAHLEKTPTRKLVGFELENDLGPVPKECHLVIEDGEIAGRVTSVARSPALGRVIGLAFVPPGKAALGSRFQIRVDGGAMVNARVTPTPFFDPKNQRQEM
ncbi:MAG: (2Fe-2S)-binding protein [Alphaproteobacteria bacterium]|nr:(2Fe-2S)-binding protein [Alphaproteobacteria bacterium]